jgi:hypothetical protein
MQERPSKHPKEVRWAKWTDANGREIELFYDEPVSIWRMLKDGTRKLREQQD